MARLTRKQKEARAKVDRTKLYSLEEASALVKEISNAKFDASVDLAVRLGVDPRKANQMVRGVVSLPHGTGKNVKVLAVPCGSETTHFYQFRVEAKLHLSPSG